MHNLYISRRYIILIILVYFGDESNCTPLNLDCFSVSSNSDFLRNHKLWVWIFDQPSAIFGFLPYSNPSSFGGKRNNLVESSFRVEPTQDVQEDIELAYVWFGLVSAWTKTAWIILFLSLRGRYDRSNLLEIKRLPRRSFLTPRNDSSQSRVFVQTLVNPVFGGRFPTVYIGKSSV